MQGGPRRDFLNGESGDDVLQGGRGRDEARFLATYHAGPRFLITANLKTGIASGQGSDRLSSIEDLKALTRFGHCCPTHDVHFIGDAGPNVFHDDWNGGGTLFEGGGGKDLLIVSKYDDIVRGGRGDDRLVFSSGDFAFDGNDQAFGGAGTDWLQLYPSGGATVTNLSKGTSRGQYIENDKVAGIENLSGGYYNDTIIGNSGRNVLLGHQANDKLVGGGGRDAQLGGKGKDMLNGRLASDKNNGGLGDADTCQSPGPRAPKSINCER
jgi:Ca2+-binding RTX toxin-like protein